MGGVGALQEVPGRWHCPCGIPAGSPLGPSLGKRLPREEAGSEASDSCPGPARSFPVGRGPEERGAELCSSFRASTASWGGGRGGGSACVCGLPHRRRCLSLTAHGVRVGPVCGCVATSRGRRGSAKRFHSLSPASPRPMGFRLNPAEPGFLCRMILLSK